MNYAPSRTCYAALLALVLMLGGSAAHAAAGDAAAAYFGEPPPVVPSPITDHFALLGIYDYAHVGTNGQVNPTNGTGTFFNAEQNLGLSDKAHQALIELQFRMAERSHVRIDFFDLPRQDTRPLKDTQLQFGNALFVQGDKVYTNLSWREMDFTYTYSILKTERFEVGPGIGLHLIQAEITGSVNAKGLYQDYSAATPFGTLALDATWRIFKRWSLVGHYNYFRLHYNGDVGELGDFHEDLQFRAWANLAIGGGYEWREMQVAASNTTPSGQMLMVVKGPELFLRASF
jgi:hypothetical protein